MSATFAIPASDRPSIADVAAELERLAAETGDPAYSRAARALFWDTPGRRPINDAAAIAEAQWLVRTGGTKSLNAALRQIAKTFRTDVPIKSIVERLRRKVAISRKISSAQ